MVNYRLAEESDYVDINAFHNQVYGANRSIEQFRWEFCDCPHGKSIYVIAEDEGKIVGTNCVIPIDLVDSNGQIIRSGKSEDTLVDPEYRGQKIFYHIYEFLFEKCREADIKVIWGFTSAKKPFKKLGFDVPFDHKQALAVKNVWKSYKYLSSLNPRNKFADRVKILGLCCFSRIRALEKLQPGKTDYQIEEDKKVIAGVDELILKNQLSADALFAIHQTEDFQDWRIYKNPNYYRVHTYSVHQDNELVALIVFNSHPNQTAYVCQSTFHPTLSGNEKVKLLQLVTKMLFSKGIVLVRNWLFHTNKVNHGEVSIYENSGYTLLERGIGLVWKELEHVDIKPQKFYLSRVATQGTI